MGELADDGVALLFEAHEHGAPTQVPKALEDADRSARIGCAQEGVAQAAVGGERLAVAGFEAEGTVAGQRADGLDDRQGVLRREAACRVVEQVGPEPRVVEHGRGRHAALLGHLHEQARVRGWLVGLPGPAREAGARLFRRTLCHHFGHQ